MAFALVADVATAPGSGGGTTTPAINTTGATLLIVALAGGGDRLTGFSDSKSNSWSALTDHAPSIGVRILYCANPTVGSGHTFTYTTGGSYPVIMAQAWSGASATPFDAENGNVAGSCASLATGNITPAEDGELLVSAVTFNNDSPSETIDLGFTLGSGQNFGGGNNYGGGIAYQIQTTATARNPTWSGASGLDRGVALAAFKAGAGPPPPTFIAPQPLVIVQAVKTAAFF